MTHFQKLKTLSTLKWVSPNFIENHHHTSRLTGSFHIALNPRFYGTKRASTTQTEKAETLSANSISNSRNVYRVSPTTRKQAQAALLEYFHSTRGMQFLDAENMSKNSPTFIEKLVKSVENEGNVGRSISRFLRYHPVNEFEVFFESLGLKPSEFVPLLPRDLMFLSDDDLLLENYSVLCNYGISRPKIGNIYKEVPQVFRYDYGVLQSKLRAYENLGLNQSTVVKVTSLNPYILIGDVKAEFVKVLEKFKSYGFESNWIEVHMLEEYSYNWNQILELLHSFSKIGFSEDELGRLINHHPDFLFECSGNKTLSLIGFLLKLGSTRNQIYSMFLQFPQLQVGKFLLNLKNTFVFLTEIEMNSPEIGKMVRSHSVELGSSSLKRTSSLLCTLNVGKKRLCKIILENPEIIRNWRLGTRVKRLPKSEEDLRSQAMKIEFLLRLGMEENSAKMKKALKVFRGRGGELQERFDLIVKAGLDEKEVCRMVEVSPQILNQTKDVIEMKLDYLVNDLSYPISTLTSFPSYLSYTKQRVKLRLDMYEWLQGKGAAEPGLALSTVIACSEKTFLTQYVNRHPSGPRAWQNLKNRNHSE